ncbi:MAG: hypothetical protein ACYTHK_09600 [Planctomycetota bacterium]
MAYLLGLGALAFAGPVRDTPTGPDLFYFQRHLAADLHQKCAGCHSDPESAGRFFLAPLDSLTRPDHKLVLKNYRATLAFLDAEEPERSALLRKPRGADAHGGGELITSTGSAIYERMLYFAMGATLDNRPPEAIVPRRINAQVGRETDLDGTLSGDPDGSPLSYHFTIAERPAGSRATLKPDGDGGAAFTADRAGPYRIELRVHDGRLWSLRTSMLVVAEPAPATARPRQPTMQKEAAPAKRDFLDRRLDTDRLRTIRRLYMDLQWRTPRLDEIRAAYDLPHAKLVDRMLDDPEVWNAWYEQQLFYFLLLDRFRPKQGRVTTIPERLAKNEIPVPIALREIIASTYFNDRNPGNDTFCTVVLEQCCGLVVQERKNLRTLNESKKMYDGYKAKIFKTKGASQSDFVRICFAQRIFFEHLLRRSWKELHGSEIGKEQLRKDADRFQNDPWAFRAILRDWLTGPAYTGGVRQARTKPEIPYVRGLFVDALGRVPTYEELRNVRNAFLSLADPTPIRLVMGRVLLESPQSRLPDSALEAERFVKEQFLRLFARPPSARELNTFVQALKNDPDVTPRVVLWTLISSPEYQTY